MTEIGFGWELEKAMIGELFFVLFCFFPHDLSTDKDKCEMSLARKCQSDEFDCSSAV